MNTSETSQHAPTPEEIAARAYEIYEREGRPENRDFNHWLAAETQLIAERHKPAGSATATMRLLPAPKTATVVSAALVTSRISRTAGRPSAAQAR